MLSVVSCVIYIVKFVNKTAYFTYLIVIGFYLTGHFVNGLNFDRTLK